jgi:hypothetical protein
VLALPIESVEERQRPFRCPILYLKYAPKNVVVYEYANEPVSVDHKTLRFKTSLLNPVSKQKESVELIPMGQTILRQVTFK